MHGLIRCQNNRNKESDPNCLTQFPGTGAINKDFSHICPTLKGIYWDSAKRKVKVLAIPGPGVTRVASD